VSLATATPRTVDPVLRQQKALEFAGYTLVCLTGLLLLVVARSTAPRPLAIALAVLGVIIASWFVKPLLGLCATVFFALVGDIVTSPWYPFTKGFSAGESIMFVNNRLIFSPLELCLIAGFLALFVRFLIDGPWPFRLGPAGPAVLSFSLFVVVGLIYGGVTGGDRHIALFEVRPFAALLAMYIFTSSICRTFASYRYLLWSVLAAIELHALISLQNILALPAERLKLTESLVDHGAVMRMNLLLIVVIASWALHGNSLRSRITATVLAAPVITVYLIAQRRAAIIALLVALALFGVILLWRQRKTFVKVVPVVLVVFAAYVGAFWNSQGTLGFPAQAVKSVISPDQVTSRNQSSDVYRKFENYDLNFTIRSNKVLGLGLGKAFYRPAQLADLTGFTFNAFIPHNSLLWIWISFGFGGFVALFCLLGRTIMLGAAAIRTARPGSELTVLIAFVLFIVAFSVFSAVDIAWDAGNMVLLGVSVATAASYPRPDPRPLRSDAPSRL
jgi:O-Antigen ligase